MFSKIIIFLLGLIIQNTFANTPMTIVFYNYTGDAGTAFLGNNPQVFGPVVNSDGNSATWATTLDGFQQVGLQISPNNSPVCYTNVGVSMLDEAIYKGDIISILYGQPQLPTGLACGCFGSACDVG